MKILKFEEFINEQLWSKGIERSKSGTLRKEDCVVNTKEELLELIKKYIENKTGYVDLNFINTSNITDMSYLFSTNGIDTFIQIGKDINKLDISNVDIDISKWDVSNVENMSHMFNGCKNFNCDLSNWDVSNVEKMYYMFYECEKFNSDLSKWDVSNVIGTRFMFGDCYELDCDLSKWDVSNVENMDYMFDNCKNMNIPNWFKGLE